MTEYLDRRTPNRVRAQLEAARTAGAWMPWAGAAMALLLWGGIAAWLVATIGPAQIFAQPPMMLAGGFVVAFATGLTLVVVTHDPQIGERARRRLRLCDGRVVEDLRAEGGR